MPVIGVVIKRRFAAPRLNTSGMFDDLLHYLTGRGRAIGEADATHRF